MRYVAARHGGYNADHALKRRTVEDPTVESGSVHCVTMNMVHLRFVPKRSTRCARDASLLLLGCKGKDFEAGVFWEVGFVGNLHLTGQIITVYSVKRNGYVTATFSTHAHQSVGYWATI